MAKEAASPKPRRLVVLLPLALFLGLAALFLMQLLSGRDISAVPSALIGQPAPETKLPPLEGTDLPGLDSAAFAGKVTLVNVWASWCAPCREEHPLLLALSQDKRFGIAGLNYKDEADAARRWLDDLGDPYRRIGVDGTGRVAIDWGVYGVPETFVVDARGRIRYRHVGPLTAKDLTDIVLPMVEALRP